MNNWLCDQAPRVLRTIDKIVDKVKETVQGAVDIWKRVSEVLDRALMPHPEARVAVLRAIEEEFILCDAG